MNLIRLSMKPEHTTALGCRVQAPKGSISLNFMASSLILVYQSISTVMLTLGRLSSKLSGRSLHHDAS